MLRSKMNLELFLTVVLFITIHSLCARSTHTPLDNYLIACCSSENISHLDRTFLPDSRHSSVRFDSENSDAVCSFSSSILSPIYQSARTFTTSASYKFDINQKGWHFIRLYFHPLSERLASVSFSVVTETYVLLDSFSFNISKSNTAYLFKEYAINVNTNILTLTFIPSSDSDIVFVNAIEVVSIPNEVFSFNHTLSFPFNDIALETMYRLDMGGSSSVTSQNDTIFRIWEEDDMYLQHNPFALNLSINPFSLKSLFNDVVSSEVAPIHVYATAKALKNRVSNLTWVFPIKPKFKYILRMHFCDIISKSKNSLFFNVYIDSDIVVKNLNLSALTHDVGTPYFIDVVSNISSEDSDKLSVSFEPSDLELGLNALMNGLEIMKMSNDVRSLDGLSSVDDLFPKSALKISKIAILLSTFMGASFLFVGAFYFCRCITAGRSKRTSRNNDGSLRRFTFQEIREATNNFEEKHLIGVGGFGKVFMGELKDGTRIAIKKANPQSKQGLDEFQNEIRFLSELRHQNLVSLLGYCHEDMKMILVYAYMANGSLNSHLYGPNVVVPLSWKQRLEICIGAARGLHFLHAGSSQSIIHRDVKASNILLDENFVAKVSDFGISRQGPSLDKSHVSTLVKGSFGYIDPEYFRTQRLTEKSDVYSFGVVLLEVLCGRPALNRALPTEEKNLSRWALSKAENGKLVEEITDPNLIGKAKVESMKKVWEVAKMCLEEYRLYRPTMGYVMCCLEDALHLQLTNTLMASEEK